jgi:septal ring factor EnvC (AmiA/AmiB activator)
MKDERGQPEAKADVPVLAEVPAVPAAEVALFNASVATIRADAADVKALVSSVRSQAASLQADAAERKAGTIEIMSDVVRLNQKVDRLAAALADAQADIQKILEQMATRSGMERLRAAVDALAKKP